MPSFTLITTLLAVLVAVAQAIPTISITGTKFFTSEGKQFYIKGIAYQLVEDDPLVDTAQCQRDAAKMAELGANSIRVYHVDSTADHSGCMNAFAEHGIYIWVDLDSFHTYIKLTDGSSWNQTKSDSYKQVMDNFQQFDNTAGFFVGNEVLNDVNDSGSAPLLLAAKADLRSYALSKGYRSIPIGYSATDTGALPMLADYLACRSNVSERLDFYSLNSYRWCGSSSFHVSGYDVLLSQTTSYNLPIFFSEVGCNTVPPRVFTDQAAIFGEMADVWSGAIIYEWIQETNLYGLISYGPRQDADVNEGSSVVQGFTRQGVPTAVAPDFDNLKQQWATLNPTGVDSKAYAATVQTSPPACPTSTPGTSAWTVDPSAPLLSANAASGMISETSASIPRGSITVKPSASESSVPDTTKVAGSSQNSSNSIPNLPPAGTNPSATATSAGAGSRTVSTPVHIDTSVTLHTILAIAAVCLGAMVFL